MKIFKDFIKAVAILFVAFIVTMILIVAFSDSSEETQYKAEETLSTPVEVKEPVVEEIKSPYTMAQTQAIDKAKDYLEYDSFSKQGLIEQLEYEGFSKEDATFAVNIVYK